MVSPPATALLRNHRVCPAARLLIGQRFSVRAELDALPPLPPDPGEDQTVGVERERPGLELVHSGLGLRFPPRGNPRRPQ